ncbi:MAG: hypothetical protein JSU94_05220 [Phycisphaerales bacterium]|nr:MAG: hypothetical protein JSU94_05220 [Phycisphaerales bacterium]
MKERFWIVQVALVVLFAALPAATSRAEIVAYWDFDDVTGSVARDKYGDNHGSLKGGPRRVTGRVGGALSFDGRDDYVDFGAGDVFAITDQITIAMWILPDERQIFQPTLLSKGDRSWRIAIFHDVDILELSCTGTTGEFYCGRTGVRDGRWHHIAGVYDGGKLSVYLDGVLDASKICIGKIAATPDPVWVGGNSAYGLGRLYRGLIDEVIVFDEGLSDEQVAQLYEHGVESFIPGSLATLIEDAREVKSAAGRMKPADALALSEKKVTEWSRFKRENPDGFGARHDVMLSGLYLALAEAGQGAGAPAAKIVAAYKQAAVVSLGSSNYVPALLRMYKRVSSRDFGEAVKQSIRNSDDVFGGVGRASADLAASKNRDALKLFLDAVFSEVEDVTGCAEAVSAGLSKSGGGDGGFIQYCRDRPRLWEHFLRRSEELAAERMGSDEFAEAAEIYRDMLSRCDGSRKMGYELQVCECLFRSGRYEEAIGEIDGFAEKYRATERLMILEALLFKGRAYLHTDKRERALELFLKLMIDYPEAEKASEAGFFAGYCIMLDGNLSEAETVFGMVIRRDPESAAASKSRLCLRRIAAMKSGRSI